MDSESRNNIPENEETPEIPIIELEGEQYEVIDTVTVDGRNYVALLPFEELDAGQEEEEFTILEIIDDPDDEENCTLKTIDDEDLYDRIGDAFLKQFEMYDEEDE